MTENNARGNPDQNQPDPENFGASERPHKPADDREEVYFEGSPLLRAHLGTLALCTLIAAAFIAAPIVLYVLNRALPWWASLLLVVLGILSFVVPVLVIRSVRYRISNYRIDFERGILSKSIDTLELWHVDDILFYQSLTDRLLGVGTITVMSHDDTTPKLVLAGLPQPRPLFESLKQRVISVKRQRGVIKMDLG